MKTAKRITAVILAALVLLAYAPFAAYADGSTKPDFTVRIEAGKYVDGNWQTVTTVAPGEEIKARVYLGSQINSYSLDAIFFYDNAFYSTSYGSFTDGADTLGPAYTGYFVDIQDENSFLTNALVSQNQITQEESEKYNWIYVNCYDGDESTFNAENYFFEFTLNVKSDAKGTGTITALPGTFYNEETEVGYFVVQDADAYGFSVEVNPIITPASTSIPCTTHEEFESKPAVPATCEKDGSTAEISCSVCGKVVTESEIVPAAGHDLKADYSWSTTAQGEMDCMGWARCQAEGCGYKYSIQATVTSSVKTPADCENAGVTIYTAKFIDPNIPTTTTEEADIPATGHADNDGDGKCDSCPEILDENKYNCSIGNHSAVNDEAVPATCDKDGKAAGTHCEHCGTVLSGNTVIPATGHADNDGDGKCDSCKTTIGSGTNEKSQLEKTVILAPKASKVLYKDNVTVEVAAKNVPAGYVLKVVTPKGELTASPDKDGNCIIKSNIGLMKKNGTVTATIEKGGKVAQNSKGELKTTSEITVKSKFFFDKIIAFFKFIFRFFKHPDVTISYR